MEKVLASQREASAAVGRNYGHRPASYKGSLALKVDRYTVRKKSRSRSPDRGGGGGGGRDRRRGRSRSNSRGRDGGKNEDAPSAYTSSVRGNDANSREQIERMKKLKEKYGDASAR
jgi:pre-mRNA-splicing factor 38B